MGFALFLLTTIPQIYSSLHGKSSPITAKHNRSQATSTGSILISLFTFELFASVLVTLSIITLLLVIVLFLLFYVDIGDVKDCMVFEGNEISEGTEDMKVDFTIYFVLSLQLS